MVQRDRILPGADREGRQAEAVSRGKDALDDKSRVLCKVWYRRERESFGGTIRQSEKRIASLVKDVVMKAEELMIGDWYMNSANEPCKVVKNFGDVVWGEGNDIADSTDNPLSIPLTEEILEKNGFKIANPTTREWWTSVGSNLVFFTYHLLDDEQPCRLAVPNRGEIKHIRYVHELQHALRLCGLRELADNFKV